MSKWLCIALLLASGSIQAMPGTPAEDDIGNFIADKGLLTTLEHVSHTVTDRASELVVAAMARTLLDRDTAPGAEPEDLMRLSIPALIVPGKDESHATSAARYFEECLAGSQYWDVAPDAQTGENAPARLLQFLESVTP